MLKVQGFSKEFIFTEATKEEMLNYILNHLAKCPNGEESLSFLIDCIRSDTKINFPTLPANALSIFEALGFKEKQYYGKVKQSDLKWCEKNGVDPARRYRKDAEGNYVTDRIVKTTITV